MNVTINSFHTCSSCKKCTCRCYGSFNAELCRKLGGKHCQTPFHDPLHRHRNVLAPNQVFGTSDCFSGYEGIANGIDGYSSCHLLIYEPGFGIRYSRAIISLSTLAVISMCLLAPRVKFWFKKWKRTRRQPRHSIGAQKTNMQNAFEYATKEATKEK